MTNGEYLAFMADGGYQRPELWLSAGWGTSQDGGWEAPLYWEQQDGRWLAMTLAGWREVDPAEPVTHVSYYEADAYAHWAGARLPSEAEWELASADVPMVGNFVESGRYQPAPLDVATDGGIGLQRMFGDVWEWTHSTYGAVPRASRSPKAPSANTTANSWSTSTCCAAARAPRRATTSAARIATSFPPMPAGSSWVSAWPGDM